MGLYGGDAPSPDPRIGEAAVMSAQIGQDYLTFMRSQADITNQWAAEDRTRSLSTFRPLEDAYIAEAQAYDSPERKAAAASEAVADVRQQSAMAADQNQRRLSAMGVRPDSGRSTETARKTATATGLAAAGASNMARRRVEGQAEAMRANSINMGKGLAVNPATSMGLSNNANASGFQGAMNGQQQMGSLLNTQYQQQMQQWQANQSASASLFGGLGNIAGLMIASSKDVKTDKRKTRGVLDAVNKMPVEEWTYKDGVADGGRHVGPYAEDFKAATGKGDGKSIPVVDAIGVTMGAVQELSQKVDKLEGKKPKARSVKTKGASK